MKDIRVNRIKLLDALKENRTKHLAIFLEAQEKFRSMAIEHLERMLKDAREGRAICRSIGLSEPMNQTRDYDRAIAMLEFNEEDFIVLSEHDFQCYVLDDWSWKRNFLHSNSTYSMEAREEYARTNRDDIEF